MADPGFVSGFVGVGIDMAIKEMLRRINIAFRCRKGLESLQSLLISLQDINSLMQMFRLGLKSGQLNFSKNLRPASVDKWLRKLNMLLQEAAEMAQECTIPRYKRISRYRTSKIIVSMIKIIKKHLENAGMISITIQLVQSLCHVQQSNREMTASSSFSSTLPLTESTMYVGEPLVLGTDMAFTRLQELVRKTSLVAVVGMGGSGKSLVLKKLFNGLFIEDLFVNDLLLWLTVSQTPPFDALRKEFVKQMTFQLNERIKTLEGEHLKTWLNCKLSGKNFILFPRDP